MKCTNKAYPGAFGAAFLFSLLVLAGCGSGELPFAYRQNTSVSAFQITAYSQGSRMEAFASSLCVGNDDVTAGASVDMSEATAAGLFDVNNSAILYAKNIHERLEPASLTKLMTAVVALREATPEDTITVTEEAMVTEYGAQLCGLEVGDTLTMNQALHALLINSANDAANAIAVHVGGSLEGFAAMMNEEAINLGATASHFVNANGLSDDNHYSTAYDIYLIFNEAVKNELIREIIHMNSYETFYQDSGGSEKEMSFNTTNLFLRGEVAAPSRITVIGGKTGTTNAAGNCLALYSKDASGNPYISVILRSTERAIMYGQMTEMLEEIYN